MTSRDVEQIPYIELCSFSDFDILFDFGLISVLRPFNTFEVISGAVSQPSHIVPGQASYAVYVVITRWTTGGHDIFITCPAKSMHLEPDIFITCPAKSMHREPEGLEVHAFCGTGDDRWWKYHDRWWQVMKISCLPVVKRIINLPYDMIPLLAENRQK